MHLHYEREVGQIVNRVDDILKSPYISLYHRTDTLDVRLRPSKHIQLDRNNMADIELDTGWNEITSAEVRVKAATGGLRLLTSQAKCIGPSSPSSSPIQFSKPPDGGLFSLRSIPRHTTIRIRFPYNVEHDVTHVSIRVEVIYTTASGIFAFSKTPSVPIALALGVNVQDIFKHRALFSRFTVSTATHSPLRLYGSELLGSEIFESASGLPPPGGGGDEEPPVVIFARQPASLLYRITRRKKTRGGVNGDKATVTAGPKPPQKTTTMHLRLHYSVLQDEIEALFEDRLTRALEGKENDDGHGHYRDDGNGKDKKPPPALRAYARHVVATALPRVAAALGPHDLERAALVGAVPTACLSSIDWAQATAGLGTGMDGGSGGDDIPAALEAFVRKWQARNPMLELPTPRLSSSSSSPTTNPSTTTAEGGGGAAMAARMKAGEAVIKSILIPVDIPSVTIVHTADIRLSPPPPALSQQQKKATIPWSIYSAGEPVFCTNQLIPATLRLRWTRIWDTATPPARQADLEFSYEVVAPPPPPPPPSSSQFAFAHDGGDNNNSSSSGTWLLGGRRKGHFVIPAPGSVVAAAAAAATTGGGGKDGKGGKEGGNGDDEGEGEAGGKGGEHRHKDEEGGEEEEEEEEEERGLSSTPDTEAEIPILMIPLREGWLPYPNVEIREVRPSSDSAGSATGAAIATSTTTTTTPNTNTNTNTAESGALRPGRRRSSQRTQQQQQQQQQGRRTSSSTSNGNPSPPHASTSSGGSEMTAAAAAPSQSPNPASGGAGAGAGAGAGGGGHYETDYRNVGETVRVVADRARVTLSLDAGGPGGGPLVLDVQRRWGGYVEDAAEEAEEEEEEEVEEEVEVGVETGAAETCVDVRMEGRVVA